MSDIDNRRAIIDRRALAERMSAEDAAALLAEALADGRVEIARRLAEQPGAGRAAAQATSFLHDQIVRLAYDQSGAPLGPRDRPHAGWAVPTPLTSAAPAPGRFLAT